MSAIFKAPAVYLKPAGRGRWTSPDGAYEVRRADEGIPFTVRAAGPGATARTGAGSLGAALDAVIAHCLTGLWNLDATSCPARDAGEGCSLLRGAHQVVSPRGGWLPGGRVMHLTAAGRKWEAMPA